MGIPLCEGAEQLLVVPVLSGDPGTALDVPGKKIFMKSGRELVALRELLRERGLLDHARMVADCGLPTEEVFESLDELDEDKSYMAVVLLT